MKKFSALIVLIIAMNSLIAQSKKVLFLGNSFTYTFDIPNLFNQLAVSAGVPVIVDSYTQSGIAVANEQVTGHINDAAAQAKISSQLWDFVVVQDNQGDYVNSAGIPSACGSANVTLYNQIKANNACTQIIYFAGWGPSGGTFTGDNTQNCIDRIYTNMVYLNNNVPSKQIVTPIGKAWKSSLTSMPSVNLFYPDNVHPSLEGSYLAAATIFTTILKRNPISLTYTGGVNSTTALNMRTIAYNTVTNSTLFTQTQLSIYTPSITTNGNILTSTTPTAGSGTASFQWYLNGNTVGTNSYTLLATTSGTYNVVVTKNGCKYNSFPATVTVVTTGLDDTESLINFSVYPNPSNGIFTIQNNNNIHFVITNAIGQVVFIEDSNSNQSQIDLTHLSKGMYFLKASNNDGNKIIKIILE